MASSALEYQARLLSLSEKMYFTPVLLGSHRKPKRRHDLELSVRSKPRVEDSSHAVKVVSWLKSLPAAARYQVICDRNQWLSACIRQMFVRKAKEGEGVFSLVQEHQRPYESTALDDNFKYRRTTVDFIPVEKYLEENLRFTDCQESLDTVTFAPELVCDFEKLLRAIAELTHCKAFQWPCRVVWDAAAKVWLWETPGWNSGVDQPLVVWAVSCIERHIWMKYWEAMKLDPRAATETQPYSMDLPVVEGYLVNRATLIDHWKELSQGARAELVASAGELEGLFNSEKSKWLKESPLQYSYPQPSFSTLANSFSSSLMGLYGGTAGSYYSACRARMQSYQNSKSVEFLAKALFERDFVDFLFLSPIDRAGSIFDSVTRVIAGRISASYQKKLADDLIACEFAAKNKRTAKKPAHKPKPRRKSSDVSTAGTAQGHTTEDEEDVYSFISSLLNDLIAKLPLPQPDIDDLEGFQVVSTKRRPKATNKPGSSVSSPKKKQKSKGKRGRKATVTKSRGSPQKPIASQAIFWAESEVPSSLPAPAKELFPPLSTASEVASFSTLHYEILAFEGEMMAISARKAEQLEVLLENLKGIVTAQFPGAEVALFGSYSTRLALPSSDMDVVIQHPLLRHREDLQLAVHQLAAMLRLCDWTLSATALDSASVPLVKLQALTSCNEPLLVDISFEGGAHLGLASAKYVRSAIEEHHMLRPLVLVLKHFLVGNELNCAYRGGISSYALVIWTIAYLCQRADICDLGEALVGFLLFYGKEFNPKTTGIDLNLAGKYSPNSPFFQLRTESLAAAETIDPVCASLNTTKSAFRLPEVLSLLATAGQSLSHSPRPTLADLFALQR